MKRAKHSLSHYKLLTCDMGELVPVSLVEVLPGDTFQHATSALIRVSPLVAPVMHPVTVRIHHWFVPNRLVWDGWEDFITGGADGLGGDAGAYPTLTTETPFGGVGDYLGVPPNYGTSVTYNAMPFRAYNLIWNEHYRDQDLQTERDEDDVSLASVSWEKDYFTSARPWTQKGPDVTLPLGLTAPVIAAGSSPDDIPRFTIGSGGSGVLDDQYLSGDSTATNHVVWGGGSPGVSLAAHWDDPNLVADLSTATSVDVNTVRRAFALQRYEEARARYGSRYTEYLRYLGVRSSDARLQRPEYLGGGKQSIAFSEVLQLGPDSSDDGVGSLKGHGIAAMRTARYRRFFEEHGYVLSLMSVRPKTLYTRGLARTFSRRLKEDYYQRELVNIGQQEVFRSELDVGWDLSGTEVFGYQDRYDEYRRMESSVHGEFRTTLNYWHLSRDFAAEPVLNSSFVTCSPSKRIHAVQTNDVLWCMVNNSIQARRMVPKSAAGRII